MNVRLILLAAMFSSQIHAAEKLNPRDRDEDISGTTIATAIKKLPDGRYSYTYTFKNPNFSKDDVSNLHLDVFCPGMPDIGKQNIDSQGKTRDEDHSRDGRHVRLESKLVGFKTRLGSFTARNVFRSGLGVLPGYERQLELVSANKPGYLHFTLEPTMNDEGKYDYTELWANQGDVPDIPWYDDWEVHGLIKGPACEGYEANPLTRPIFDGQLMPEEQREINGLLRYEVPGNRNRWHAPASQTELKLRVYYNLDNIDPATFSATLNGRDIKALFRPGKVWDEWVTLPLEGPRTEIELSVEPRPGRYEDAERYPVRRDVDPFEIRRPIAMP